MAKNKVEQPLVSVVIPCYNYADFVGQAIDSALAQTYQNIEIIVIDDGSTDGSKAAIMKFGKRVRYKYQPNNGLSAARNAGVTLAKGKYIVFLDADDILDRCFAEKATKIIEQDKNISFVYTQLKLFGREKSITNYGEYDINRLVQANFINATTLLRAELFSKFQYNATLKKGYEDWDFYLTLAENGHYGKLLDEPLVMYRKHQQLTSMSDKFKDLAYDKRRRLEIYRHHRQLYKRSYIFKEYIIYIVLVIKKILRMIISKSRVITHGS